MFSTVEPSEKEKEIFLVFHSICHVFDGSFVDIDRLDVIVYILNLTLFDRAVLRKGFYVTIKDRPLYRQTLKSIAMKPFLGASFTILFFLFYLVHIRAIFDRQWCGGRQYVRFAAVFCLFVPSTTLSRRQNLRHTTQTHRVSEILLSRLPPLVRTQLSCNLLLDKTRTHSKSFQEFRSKAERLSPSSCE